MAIVVEDGTGLATANSLASVAGADTYHTDRGNAGWTGTDEEKEIALIKATDYFVTTWADRLRGVPASSEQALPFPRNNLRDLRGNLIIGTPMAVEHCIYELALRVRSGTDLSPDPEYNSSGQELKSETIKAGPLQLTEVRGSRSGVRVPAAFRLIRSLLRTGGRAIR